MVDYEAYGYERFRELARDNFNFIALIDDTGTEVARFDLSADSRGVLASDAGTNPLTWEVTITGSDADITTPVTLDSYELHETSSSTDAIGIDQIRDSGGNPVNATLEADADQVVLTIDQNIPQ